jgi:hypothetical protein
MTDFPTPVRIIHNGDGIILLLADRGQISVGGHGNKAGSLRLADETNAGVIGLDAATGQISCGGHGTPGALQLRDAGGRGTIGLDAASGQITVGVSGVAGKIHLENAAGERTLFLDADSGDIVLAGADWAEDFDLATGGVEPGMVMVMNDEGALTPCSSAYDKRVAGIVAGAGSFSPGIIMDRRTGSSNDRVTVAIGGKVSCQVDARYGGIKIGDLLTTSPSRGRAQCVTDLERSIGCVIGKAMGSLADGLGLLPVLVGLR